MEGAVGSEKTAGPGTGSHNLPSALSFLAGGSLRMNFESDSLWKAGVSQVLQRGSWMCAGCQGNGWRLRRAPQCVL